MPNGAQGFSVKGEFNATAEISAAIHPGAYPLLKLFGVQSQDTSVAAARLLPRYKRGWANLSEAGQTNPAAEPVAQFSAVCFNAGKELARRFQAEGAAHPIGLVDTSLGSTRVECWMPPAAIACCESVSG